MSSNLSPPSFFLIWKPLPDGYLVILTDRNFQPRARAEGDTRLEALKNLYRLCPEPDLKIHADSQPI